MLDFNKVDCLVLDDHPLVCSAIENLLINKPYIRSLDVTSNIQYAIDKLRKSKFNMLVLDLDLGKYDGFELLRRIKAHGYNGKIVIISASDNPLYIQTAFQSGAHGFFSKSDDLSILADTIERVSAGYSIFKTDSNMSVVGVKLSDRELVVLNFLIKGLSNSEISQLLSLSPKTISTYKRRILSKYNVSSIIELINTQSLEPSVSNKRSD
jgi:two-component system response regulator FimZ (fimbrial Z protein)/two-component system response regulator EvgA